MAKLVRKKRSSKKKGPPKERNLTRTDIKTIIKRMTGSRIETKHDLRPDTLTAKSGSINMYNPFDSINQSVGADGHIGDAVNLESLTMRVNFNLNGPTDMVTYRILGLWTDMKLPIQLQVDPHSHLRLDASCLLHL
jgi:hypothetical protein